MEQIAFGDFQFHAMSHRGGVLGWPEPLPPSPNMRSSICSCRREFGLMCPVSVTDTSILSSGDYGSADAARTTCCRACCRQDLAHDVEGHAVHDREGRRLRCRRDRDGGAAARTAPGGSMATSGSAPMPTPTWRCCWRVPKARRAGTRGLALFALPRRLEDGGATLPHRAAEGQARHPLDGERRDPARRRRSPIWSASARTASSR